MSANAPKSGPSAVVVIAIGSAATVAVVGVIVALSLNLMSTQSPARSVDDDEEQELTEIVLDARWEHGGALGDDDFETVEDIVAGRLERIDITDFDISVDDDQIHITFDDELDDETLDAASTVLDLTFKVDFRPVLNSGPCLESNDYTDYGPEEEVVFCDQEDFAALLLGPSELSGESLMGATTQELDDGTWGVSLTFNSTGASALASLTQRLVGAEGATDRLAFTLGGVVLESPEVTEAILDGEVAISGTMDEAQAEALAAQLRVASKGLVLSVASVTQPS